LLPRLEAHGSASEQGDLAEFEIGCVDQDPHRSAATSTGWPASAAAKANYGRIDDVVSLMADLDEQELEAGRKLWPRSTPRCAI
jgi:hypothetical protein